MRENIKIWLKEGKQSKTTKSIRKLADGSTMLGQAAKDNGLIDEIGDIYDVKEWIREELGIEPVICAY